MIRTNWGLELYYFFLALTLVTGLAVILFLLASWAWRQFWKRREP